MLCALKILKKSMKKSAFPLNHAVIRSGYCSKRPHHCIIIYINLGGSLGLNFLRH